MSRNIIWMIEERFWTSGLESFRDTLADGCVMVLPAPLGLVKGPDLLASLNDLAPWTEVEMSEQSMIEHGEWRSIGAGEYCILAYHALARRAGERDYAAYCTSTYIKSDARWMMAQHQQTPLGEAPSRQRSAAPAYSRFAVTPSFAS